jgi:hypothetical protein
MQSDADHWMDKGMGEIYGLKQRKFSAESRNPYEQKRNTADIRTNLNPAASDDANSKTKKETGTRVMFSFVKDGTLYQVIHIEQGCWSDDATADHCHRFPSDSQIVLTVGGPVCFRPFDIATESLKEEDVKENIGERHSGPDGLVKCLQILNTDRGIGLEARVYQLVPDEEGSDFDGKTKTVKERYKSLRLRRSVSAYDNGQDKAGNATAYHAYGRLPAPNPGIRNRSATFIATFRLFEGTSLLSPEHAWDIPTSREIYTYIGADPNVTKDATGSMWDTIFRKRYLLSDPISRLPEIQLIGRCLEKIMQVDIIPIRCRDPPEHFTIDSLDNTASSPFCPKHSPDEPCTKNPLHGSSVLIRNLFILPSLDYRSLL